MPLLPVVAGSAVFVGGCVYDLAQAGIRYQDPTPAMAAAFARHARVAALIRWAGLGMVLAGAATILARRRARWAR